MRITRRLGNLYKTISFKSHMNCQIGGGGLCVVFVSGVVTRLWENSTVKILKVSKVVKETV